MRALHLSNKCTWVILTLYLVVSLTLQKCHSCKDWGEINTKTVLKELSQFLIDLCCGIKPNVSYRKVDRAFWIWLSDSTYTCLQILGHAEKRVGQNAGGSLVERLAARVAAEDLLDVEAQELSKKAAALCSLGTKGGGVGEETQIHSTISIL